jgi:pimeloyl-ACP methyl ester carboxylesterase
MAIQLNYKSFGQGNPIIILHGLFGTLDNWQTIGKQLATTHTIFLVDQRNHGKSPHVVGHTYPLLAADLNYFMEQQWIFEATIIGHSMGGKTAMQFTMDYPDRVKQLIVVDIAPKAYTGGHELIINALLSLPLQEITDRTQADQMLQSFGIEEFGTRQFLLKNLTRTKAGDYEWKMNLPELHKNYEQILAKIELQEPFQGETLFLKGGKSDYIAEEDWTTIQRYFPNAQLKTIPNVGHWVHAEAPNELLNNFLSFIK